MPVSEELRDVISTMFLFISTVLVFLMQAGFAMLEAGVVQRKNIKNIISKTVLDSCVGVLAFWIVGFGVAYGCKDGECNSFIGNDLFLLSPNAAHTSNRTGYLMWLFQFSFANVVTTIASGSVTERMNLWCYCLMALVNTTLLYPVVAHWVFFSGGWLHSRMIDTAGGTAVHVLGGTCGFVGAVIVGPRIGRFDGSRFRVSTHEFPGFSTVFGSLGVLMLWFSWYGFNTGSLFPFVDRMEQVQLAVVNTTLSPSTAIVVSILLHGMFWRRALPLKQVMNACLAGLVAVTPCCAVVLPGWAILIGAISCLIYTASSWLLAQLRVDDPLDASAVHLFCGFWGLIATGIFSHPKHIEAAFPDYHGNPGLIYHPHDPSLLGWEVVGGLAVVAWGGVISTALFFMCRWCGILRVSATDERAGLDRMLHLGEDSGYSTAVNTDPGGAVIARMMYLASA